jgi:ribose-phosphate pyrophosphokinase
MDRAISWAEPFSLDVVARLINGAGFSQVRILDVHSEVATRLIRNSENLLPFAVVSQVGTSLGNPRLVCPDKGARERVEKLAGFSDYESIAYCKKVRDLATGVLSGFEVTEWGLVKGQDTLIVDDICDGGGTFVGLAKELRKAGAKKVNLFVTHGIMSKGWNLEGIDHIYTTDSCTHIGCVCGKPECNINVTVIPISMEKL